MATSATLPAAGFNTHFSAAKSTPPVIRPIGGMMIWSTRLLTMAPKAAPMITPTARSTTLPRAMNSRNSLNIGRLLFGVGVQPLAQLLAALEERDVFGLD